MDLRRGGRGGAVSSLVSVESMVRAAEKNGMGVDSIGVICVGEVCVGDCCSGFFLASNRNLMDDA